MTWERFIFPPFKKKWSQGGEREELRLTNAVNKTYLSKPWKISIGMLKHGGEANTQGVTLWH